MTIKREYSILPQGEKDDFHHHVRDGSRAATSQYLCLFTVITVVIILILAGVATLTASMFYSDQISTTYRHFWYSYESISPNDTKNTSNDSSFQGGSRDETTSASPLRNLTDYVGQNKTFDTYRHHLHNHHHDIHNNNSDDSFDKYSIGESDLEDSTNSTGRNGTEDSKTTDKEMIDLEELKEKFAEAMRDSEKYMENLTGIRKAEFLVPIFMLTCFLVLFSAISLCCCVMMKRRDNKRRKLFGKLITDLQTGDSKTVLLNHSDLDD